MRQDPSPDTVRRSCVLDASFSLQWLFRDEASPEGYAALAAMQRQSAIVPQLWITEVMNGLGQAERRGRIDQAELSEALGLLRSLPLEVDQPRSFADCEVVLELMRAHRLTAYDATYLELAQRRDLPLATLDKALRQVAAAVGVSVLQVVA